MSLCSALGNINKQIGKFPSDIVVCVDRKERTEESSVSAKHAIESRYGVSIHPIVDLDDIIRAVNSGVISAGEYSEKLNEYAEIYKGD
jgi:orotate phosphoribosyltransferase